MLSFLRRNQKIFFIFTTIIIVFSFAFFGTYESLNAPTVTNERVVFTTLKGRQVMNSELDEFVQFLRTDLLDKLYTGGAPGFNFLNDGVVRRDFVESGLATILMKEFREELREDYQLRSEKEKRYRPYAHPQAQFISAMSAWNYLAPKIPTYLDQLQSAVEPLSDEAIEARVNLYLAETHLPGGMLRQVLQQQETQQEWVRHDPLLDRADLSLFGYHSADDWFGNRVLHLMAQVILNAAEEAEATGMVVTKEEAYASLVKNAQLSFQQLRENSGAPNSNVYLQQQLQRMQLSESRVVQLWRKVLLFRRSFQQVGNAVFVDRYVYEKVAGFANEGVKIDLYEYPKAMQLARYEDLQRLETYLDNTTSQSGWNREGPLALPTVFFPADTVMETAPELVQKRYLVRVASVDKESLQSRVTVRSLWQWQGDDDNWAQLVSEFPELAQVGADDFDARIEALDSLKEGSRAKIDRYSRAKLVDEHPEWIEESLSQETPEPTEIAVRLKGGNLPFDGVTNRQELVDLLDNEAQIELYTPDEKHFYRIEVIGRTEGWELLSFAQAEADGTLEAMAEERLEKHYKKIRNGAVVIYRKDDGEWRPLSEVKNHVADNLYSGVLRAIKQDYLDHGGDAATAEEKTSSFWARQRMNFPLREMHDRFLGGADEESLLVKKPEPLEEGVLPAAVALDEQWRLRKQEKAVRRGDGGEIPVEATLDMDEGAWSSVITSRTGSPFFYQAKGPAVDDSAVEERVLAGQRLLSNEAQRTHLRSLLAEMEERAPSALDYLHRG